MKLDLTGRHFTVTPPIKKHAKDELKKIEKLLENKKITSVHLILSVEKYRHRAELLVNWHDHALRSLGTTNDMYLAITQAVEKMERQTLKLKEKLTTQSRKARGEVKVKNAAEVPEPTVKPPRLIRSRAAVKPLSTDEAVETLTGMEDQFIVFRNSETERVTVVYKRKDGNFGLIEP